MAINSINKQTALSKRVWEMIQKNPERYVHYTFVHHDLESPRRIIPKVAKYVPTASVVDVGCGLGAWLKVFEERGTDRVLGIDGDYLNLDKVLIAKKDILKTDLEALDQFPTQEKFDLSICLEVAGHLKPAAAENLVAFLTHLSDAVLFSAAIPFQGGLHHINEQWPAYWQALFAKHGFQFHDLIRPVIWNDSDIKWWYRQNIFLVCKAGKFDLPAEGPIRNMVHPELFLNNMKMQKDGQHSTS